MSQLDLDTIQTKLKLAIQNHQTLVAKLKSDPKNELMRTNLRELQIEIMNLSERQKHAVQNLRKEIVQKQSSHLPVPKPLPVVQQYVSIAPQLQTVAITCPTSTLLSLGGTSVSLVSIPAAHYQNASTITLPLSITNTTVMDLKSKVSSSDQPVQKLNSKVILNETINRSSSPPIRVPQYPLNSSKTSILQRSSINQPDTNSQSQRKLADNNVQKSGDSKKQLSPMDKQKLQYMAALDLVTPETLKELQSKRTERKRRSTANPQFSYIEPVKKYSYTGYMLNSLAPAIKRGRGRPPKHGPSPNNSRPNTPDNLLINTNKDGRVVAEDQEEYLCAICNADGQVLQCNSCYKVFHMSCLDPPLICVPTGYWCCSSCQATGKVLLWNKTESMAVVNSYIATKTVKEDEKRKLQRKTTDLINERSNLEATSKELTENLTNKLKCNQELSEHNKQTKQDMETLNHFIHTFQS